MEFPVGYKFRPSDEELVGYYLYKRVGLGQKFQSDDISDCPGFYGGEEPWVIWDEYGGSDDDGEPLFFFTRRPTLLNSKQRFKRNVGSGRWTALYSKRVVANGRTGRVTGTRRDFRYEPQRNNSCVWVMQEFELSQSQSDDRVLCVLNKKKNTRRRP